MDFVSHFVAVCDSVLCFVQIASGLLAIGITGMVLGTIINGLIPQRFK